MEGLEILKKRFRVWKYTIAVFVIIVFIWWLQGGHIIPFLSRKPSLMELMISSTANAFKVGLATIFDTFLNLLK